MFILSSPGRTREIFNLVENTLLQRAGIHCTLAKHVLGTFCGEQPPDIDDLGDDVWSSSGVMILETSLGSGEFLSRIEDKRRMEEHRLWDSIPWSPDLHCAWQVLIQCAGPRCHHLLRTASPSLTRHRYLADLGSIVGHNPRRSLIATLTMRMEGVGVGSPARMAPEAFWASWADAMPMLEQRLPQIMSDIMSQIAEPIATGCLGECGTSGPRRVCGRAKLVRARTKINNLQNLASGNMGGSTTRLLPNTMSGRPWFMPNHQLPTRLICGRTLARARARF